MAVIYKVGFLRLMQPLTPIRVTVSFALVGEWILRGKKYRTLGYWNCRYISLRFRSLSCRSMS